MNRCIQTALQLGHGSGDWEDDGNTWFTLANGVLDISLQQVISQLLIKVTAH
ncbi:MAG: hypothetical protein HRU20_01965 [Pseudomonadales bacterium]|nr:hypothetical protein [Pseudomonadales bacterium]